MGGGGGLFLGGLIWGWGGGLYAEFYGIFACHEKDHWCRIYCMYVSPNSQNKQLSPCEKIMFFISLPSGISLRNRTPCFQRTSTITRFFENLPFMYILRLKSRVNKLFRLTRVTRERGASSYSAPCDSTEEKSAVRCFFLIPG